METISEQKSVEYLRHKNSLSGIIRVQRGGRTMPASRAGEKNLGHEEQEEFGKADGGHFSGQNTHTPSQKVEVETQAEVRLQSTSVMTKKLGKSRLPGVQKSRMKSHHNREQEAVTHFEEKNVMIETFNDSIQMQSRRFIPCILTSVPNTKLSSLQ